MPKGIRTNPHAVGTAKREDLVQSYRKIRELRNEFIKREVIENGRIDILCEQVLGYECVSHHQKIVEHQDKHRKSLVLAFRGAGKSTISTVARCIHLILKNPNIRILIASKTAQNANDFLREIKKHFESNEKLIEVFGNYVGTDRWDTTAIEVRHRTIAAKEPTINTLGVESAVVSKHYDVIICDDLIDEENSRTPQQRERIVGWFYSTLIPCLEPPDDLCADRGKLFMLGTRYHPEDLYGYLMQYDMRDSTLRMASLVDADGNPDLNGESSWPGKYTKEHLLDMKRNMGTVRFMLQMQCDVTAYTSAHFRYDDFKFIENDEDIPQGLRIFMGVDLAISLVKTADKFAIAVVGFDVLMNMYILDAEEKRIPFHEQQAMIGRKVMVWNPIKAYIEANAYQMALVQELRRTAPDPSLFKPVYTSKDKKTRSQALSAYAEAGRVFVLRRLEWVVEKLLLFPDEGKDIFDALDFAFTKASKRTAARTIEPKLYTFGGR